VVEIAHLINAHRGRGGKGPKRGTRVSDKMMIEVIVRRPECLERWYRNKQYPLRFEKLKGVS
jgi:hypothetical protein